MSLGESDPGSHAAEVEGTDGAVRANRVVEDTVKGGTTDEVESNEGFVNGQQGE